MSTPTRKDYMDGRVTHAEYYRAVAKTAGVSYAKADPAFMDRCRKTLADGDEHLNTIPLRIWDSRGLAILNPRPAFKAHGDFVSMAGLVCLVKTAVKDALDQEALSDA